MKYFLQILGRTLAALPESFVYALCRGVGWLIYAFPTRRGLVAFSNVHHCFPDMPRSQRNRIVYESCERMVEMALFVVASPYIPKERLRARIKVDQYVLDEFSKRVENPRPAILIIPHFAMMETITMFPMLVDQKIPRTGVYYRPFDNAGLEEWVKTSRQRCGIELVSRKGGLMRGLDFLRENGCLAMLFDQNVLGSGSTTLFFDRLCSSSELPGIFIERTRSDGYIMYARRTGFWSSEIRGEPLSAHTVEDVTCAANYWLENKLKTDEIARFDWLWLHRRWRLWWRTDTILSYPDHKSVVSGDLKLRGISAVPRGRRIFITAPESLSDSIVLLAHLRTLRASACDVEITLICDYRHTQILSAIGLGTAFDAIVSAPSIDSGVFARLAFFKKMRERYPDVHLVFEDSFRADFEAFLAAAPLRLAVRASRPRRFMKDVYVPDLAESGESISREYSGFMKKFGCAAPVDFTPFSARSAEASAESVEMIISLEGSEWSDAQWGAFLSKFFESRPSAKVVIYTGVSARKSGVDIARDFDNVKCVSSFDWVVKLMSSASLMLGFESSALHAANALGVPCALVIGAQRPVRGGLCYIAPTLEIRGEGNSLPTPESAVDAAVSFILKNAKKV